jgi:uncharacterized membrane protein
MSFKSFIHMDENEAMMHLSQAIFAISSFLMVLGGVDIAVTGGVDFPGSPAVPLGGLLHVTLRSSGLELMSLGIILLAILPSLRILMVMAIYIRQRRWADVVIAAIVLLILASGTSLSRIFVK